MRRETLERYPAFAASLLLHAGVVIAVLVLGSLLNKPVFGPNVVPVTLLSGAQVPAPGIPAPTPTPAITPPEPPAPEAAPTPTPTPPAPTPSPAKSTPAPPKPEPKPAPVAPSKAPTKPTKAAPDDNALFAQLDKDLAHGGKSAAAPARPSARPTPGTGTAPSAASVADLGDQMGRRWNPNCEVMGGGEVYITVKFELGPGGHVIGKPVSSGDGSSDPIVKAASDRAVRAVYQTPMGAYPPDHYTINFDSRKYCKNQ